MNDPAYQAAYYRANREAKLEYARQRREANRERLRLEAIDYRARNPDARRKWREANIERDKARDAAYKAANADRIAAYRNSPEVKERMRVYSADWTKRNLDKRRNYSHSRRARLKGAFVESVDPSEVWMRAGGICGICSEPVELSGFHVDHIQPIVLGGEHSYANTQPAHPVCNLRKGTKAA